MVRSMLRFLSNALATFQFWYAKKTIRMDRDFSIVGTDDFIEIKIDTGKYKGTVFAIDSLKLEERGESAFLTYKISLSENPRSIDVNNKGLINYTNKIVRIILSESVEAEVKRDEQRRAFDSDESGEEREIREESPPVPKKRVPSRKPRAKTVPVDPTVHDAVQQPAKRGRPKAGAGRPKRVDRT